MSWTLKATKRRPDFFYEIEDTFLRLSLIVTEFEKFASAYTKLELMFGGDIFMQTRPKGSLARSCLYKLQFGLDAVSRPVLARVDKTKRPVISTILIESAPTDDVKPDSTQNA